MLFCNSSTIADIRKWDRSIPRDIDTYTVYKYVCPILLFFCLLSVTFNSVLLGIGHFRQKRDKTPILVLSLDLACTDTIASLINGIGLLCNSYLPIMFDIQFTTCTLLVIEIFRVGSLVASVLHLLALAIVHYRGAVRPLHYRSSIFFSQHLSRSVHLMSFLCWLLPLTVMSIYFSSIPCQGFQSSNCGFFFMLEWKYRATVLTMFAVPLAIMVIIYLKIFIIITKHHRARQHNNHHHTGTLTSGQVPLNLAAAIVDNMPDNADGPRGSLSGSQRSVKNNYRNSSNQKLFDDADNGDSVSRRMRRTSSNRLQITNSHGSCDTQAYGNKEGINNNLLIGGNNINSDNNQSEIEVSSDERKLNDKRSTPDNSCSRQQQNSENDRTIQARKNSLLNKAILNRHCSVRSSGQQPLISIGSISGNGDWIGQSDELSNANNGSNLTSSSIRSESQNDESSAQSNVNHKSGSLKSSLVDRYTLHNSDNPHNNDVTTNISVLAPSATKLKKTVSYSTSQPPDSKQLGQQQQQQQQQQLASGQQRKQQSSNIVFKTNSSNCTHSNSDYIGRHEIIISSSVNKCQSMIGIEKLHASNVPQPAIDGDMCGECNDEPNNKANGININSPEYIQQVVDCINGHNNNRHINNNKSVSSGDSGDNLDANGSENKHVKDTQQQTGATTILASSNTDNHCWFVKVFDNLFLFKRPTNRSEMNKDLAQKKHYLPSIRINRDVGKRQSDSDVNLCNNQAEKERLTSGMVCQMKQLLNEQQITSDHQLNQHAAIIKLTSDCSKSTDQADDDEYVMNAQLDGCDDAVKNNSGGRQLLYMTTKDKCIINGDTTDNSDTDHYIMSNKQRGSLIIIESNNNDPQTNERIPRDEVMGEDADDDICSQEDGNNNNNSNNNSMPATIGDSNCCNQSVNNRLLLSKQNSSISATFISNHSYQLSPNNSTSHRHRYYNNNASQRQYERKKRRSKQSTNSPGSTPGNTKALVTTLLILGTYIIFYAPAIVYLGLTCIDYCPFPLFDLKFSIRVTMGLLTNGLIIMKTIVDPFIYSYRMKEIQDAINTFLARRCKRTLFRDRGSLTASQRFTTLTRQSTYYAATNQRHFNTDSSFKQAINNNNPNSGLNHLSQNTTAHNSQNNSSNCSRVGSRYLNQQHQQFQANQQNNS